MTHKKICLITGANSGIGKEIAIAMALEGYHVIMVCRNQEKGQVALEEIKTISGNASLDLLIADLSSQTEIRSLVKIIYARYPQIHILINNAGLVLSKKAFSSDGIEMTLATNYLGPFLLTNLLIDILKKSAPARIIHVSSNIHKWAKLDLNDLQYERRKYHFMRAYAQSKLLMNISALDLSHKLNGTGVTLNCVHPGAVKTNLGSNNANNLFLKWIDKFIKFFFLTPKKSSKHIVYIATAPELENVTGQYFVKKRAISLNLSKYDESLVQKVREMSEKMVANI